MGSIDGVCFHHIAPPIITICNILKIVPKVVKYTLIHKNFKESV